MIEPSYADVAKWLPTDVRERIEATTPCPRNGTHCWHHERTEVVQFGQVEPVSVRESWNCSCGLFRMTDPEGRPRT